MKSAPPGLLALCGLLFLPAGCGGRDAGPERAPGPDSSPSPSSSLVRETPVPAASPPAPQAPAAPRIGIWSGRVGGSLLRLESRPPRQDGGGAWSFRELPGSEWKLQDARLQGGRLILQLRQGGLLQGKHARFEADFHPSASALSGQVFQGTMRMPGSLERDS